MSQSQTLTHRSKIKRFALPRKCEVCKNSVWIKSSCAQCQRCGIGFHLRCESALLQKCRGGPTKSQSKQSKKNGSKISGNHNRNGLPNDNEFVSYRPRVPSIVVRAASDENLPVLTKRTRQQSRFYSTKVIETTIVNEQSSDEECEKTINQYVVHEVLGRGAFGVVRRVTSTEDDDEYAMKEINKKKLQRKNYGMSGSIGDASGNTTADTAAMGSVSADIKREIAIMKRLDHPNVTRLYEVLNDPNSDFMYLVFERADGMIWDMVKENSERNEQQRLPDDLVWKYFRDVLAGVHYLHSCNIIHRDIKPDNLLVMGDTVKLSDFGVSEEVVGLQGQTTRSVGSVAFWAPELCKSEASEYAGKPLDVWAMGVTLYSLLVGKLPFNANSTLAMIDQIRNQDIDMNVELADNARDIIRLMLEKNPSIRPTCDDLMKHPYVTRGGTAALLNSVSGPIPIGEDDHATAITDIKKR
eukprot:CFRG0955T1